MPSFRAASARESSGSSRIAMRPFHFGSNKASSESISPVTLRLKATALAPQTNGTPYSFPSKDHCGMLENSGNTVFAFGRLAGFKGSIRPARAAGAT